MPKKKIMIVDDSGTIRQQVSITLRNAGYIVVEAEDGVDCLEKMAKTPDISMLIIDIFMPNMGGLELISKLKDAGNNTPKIVLTTEGSREAVTKAKEQGVLGWLVKPFQPNQLLEVVNKLAL
ncbi:MAG: response regulator [Oligoflexales bacterium]|nr:response regulator [Oligoflexales bacterium]